MPQPRSPVGSHDDEINPAPRDRLVDLRSGLTDRAFERYRHGRRLANGFGNEPPKFGVCRLREGFCIVRGSGCCGREKRVVDREHGAREACQYCKNVDFAASGRAFDAAFAE